MGKTNTRRLDSFSSTVSLDKYTADWTYAQAAHLLRRTTFGPNNQLINDAVTAGLDLSIDTLLRDMPKPELPIHYVYDQEPQVAIGETWVGVPPSTAQNSAGARRNSLTAWMIGQFNTVKDSIVPKMWLFWHNHFALNNINYANVGYHYLDILHEHSLGNFRTIVEEMTISPAMLAFLNGAQNTFEAPNENYARELLELFTIGRGPIAAPGDYTNYTEQDVVEMARALTGWIINTRYFTNGDPNPSAFVPNRHDQGTKQLSPRFDNASIDDAGENEYKIVIDHILQKEETAKFICRQLHIWFIGNDITQEVEDQIITPMSQIMINSNYEIKPAIAALLSSQYFYDINHFGCKISHPLDYTFKLINGFDIIGSANLLESYGLWSRLQSFNALMEMEVMNLPSVAGWQAFYQAPQYDELWINSVILPQRELFIEAMINGFRLNGQNYAVPVLEIVNNINSATDPNVLIDTISQQIFVLPLAQNQKDFLKSVLIPGLPDFEWTAEYGAYLNNPNDQQLANSITQKLQALFSTMFKMPEFHLI